MIGLRGLAIETPRTAKRSKPTVFLFAELEVPEMFNPSIDQWYVIFHLFSLTHRCISLSLSLFLSFVYAPLYLLMKTDFGLE